MTRNFVPPSQLERAEAECASLAVELRAEKERVKQLLKAGRNLYWEAQRMRAWAESGWAMLLLTWIGVVWCAWLGPALLGR